MAYILNDLNKTERYEKDCDCGWWSAKGYEYRAAVAASCRGGKVGWRDEHWEKDLQRAYDAGRKMAEQ